MEGANGDDNKFYVGSKPDGFEMASEYYLEDIRVYNE